MIHLRFDLSLAALTTVLLPYFFCSSASGQQPVGNKVKLPDGAVVQSCFVITNNSSGEPIEETHLIYFPPAGSERSQLQFVLHTHELDWEQIQSPNKMPVFGMYRYSRNMELGDEQLTEINNIQARFAEQVAALIESEFAESGGEKLSADNFDALQKRVSHLSKESEAAAFSILLPHQQEQLRQTSIQNEFIKKGGRAFLSEVLTKALELSENQKKEIKRITSKTAEKIKAAREDLDRQIREMEAEGEAQVLELLTSEQKEKLEALRGELLSSDKKK